MQNIADKQNPFHRSHTSPMVLRRDRVWEREILADNLLFILYLNNFPEHLPTYILYHSLCNLMQITFLLTFWTTLLGILRFPTKS